MTAPSRTRESNPEEAERMQRWLGRVCAQDTQALRSLYELTSPRLMSVAVQILKDDGEAADVLQEVYLKVWQQAADHRGVGSVWGWLIVTTRNASLDRLRSRNRKREQSLDDMDPADVEGQTHNALDSGVERCLEFLNGNARQAIVLSYIYGYSHQEVQQRLERPLGTVKAWIRRGLQELKRCLEA
ncbi:RNA polymerase sigma factor [Saccharospirillum impatiens]|uniref:RNA polymerase sigma factor n=1 Tax=Saccharospirillum impatiens TaxID=169438 RepID=UPI0004128921|nr:sigma-70 family RNA polymerase sigma factor [Saccharospirillum impatiens]